jgi:hypothetical protein
METGANVSVDGVQVLAEQLDAIRNLAKAWSVSADIGGLSG